ncbi:MAG: hypothetical protein M1352_02750 [Patescibacteria group bacterium]|nr:hypothetical protein [Patescibacteria group bacterium]
MSNGQLRIGVIFGGISAEKEVSLATGRYIYSLLDPQKFCGIPFYLDHQSRLWQIPDKLVIQNTTTDVEGRIEKEATRLRFEDLPKAVDLVFNALLGKYGEDGCIQGILELLRIPYTGSGILASALGMDKKMHKKLLLSQGYNVARDLLLTASDYTNPQEISSGQLADQISNSLGYPCVVKPTREGSSMGVSVVKNETGLDVALEYAFKYDNEVLIEEYLRGLEFTCVVWGNREPKAMLPTEIVFEGDFFTYEGKYMPGRTQTITPARVRPEVIKEIQRISVGVYELIGCTGYGRVDGFVVPSPSGGQPTPGVGRDNYSLPKPDCSNLSLDEVKIFVTEPHTGTIMVPSSFVFQQASQFEIKLDDRFTGKKISTPLTPRMLVTKIIEMALTAHETKKGLL